MLSQIVFTNFLYKQGWAVKKDGYDNAMVGLQTVLTKDNMEMIVRWNDFPLLIEINCTITEKRLFKRYIFFQSDYFKFIPPLFKQCPKTNLTSSSPSGPTSYDALLLSDDEYLLGDDLILL